MHGPATLTAAAAPVAGRASRTSRLQIDPDRAHAAATRVLVAYVVLWVLEGAVRKWVPGMDLAFYLVRDAMLGLAALSFFVAGAPRRRHPWWTVFWAVALTLGTHGSIAAILGTVDPLTLAIGLRAYVGWLLLLAFAATYATRRSLASVSDAVAVLALVNLPLALLQVQSSGEAWINRVTAGDDNGWLNAGEVVRATGTFSAPAGLTSFVPVALALSLAALVAGTRRRALHVASLVSVALITAVSGSRGIVLAVAVVMAVFVYLQLRRLSFRSFLTLVATVGFAVLGTYIASIAAASAIEAFQTRVEQAAAVEDTGGRLWDAIAGFAWHDFALLGSGAGAHTSVGVQRLGSVWVEVEKHRYAAELGVLGYALGAAALAAALVCLWHIAVHARTAPPARTLALAAIAPILLFGSPTQQPSTQAGFAVCCLVILLTTRLFDDDKPALAQGVTGHIR